MFAIKYQKYKQKVRAKILLWVLLVQKLYIFENHNFSENLQGLAGFHKPIRLVVNFIFTVIINHLHINAALISFLKLKRSLYCFTSRSFEVDSQLLVRILFTIKHNNNNV